MCLVRLPLATMSAEARTAPETVVVRPAWRLPVPRDEVGEGDLLHRAWLPAPGPQKRRKMKGKKMKEAVPSSRLAEAEEGGGGR